MEYDKEFEKDFVNRTLSNLKIIEDIVEKQKEDGVPLQEIEAYEVTQLINSMVGLLIFPKAKLNNRRFWLSKTNEAFPILQSIQNYPGRYRFSSTYKEDGKPETLTICSLSRHMRNALAHENTSIYPIGDKRTNEIKSIEFRDRNIYNKSDQEIVEEFKIQIPIQELKPLLTGMCKAMLIALH